jgi:hypothetical protein
VRAATDQRNELKAAIGRGQARAAAIGREIALAREGQVTDAGTAADALIEERPIPTRTEEQLRIEQRGLETAMRELVAREAKAAEAETEAQNGALAVLADAIRPSAESLDAMARQGAALLAAAYAGAYAGAVATASGAHAAIRDRLRDVIGLLGDQRVIEGKKIAVPADMLSTLRAGAREIERVGRVVPETVPVPDKAIDPFYLGLAAAGAAGPN